MKKFLAMLLALVMALSLVACGKQNDTPAGDEGNNDADTTATVKVGFITLHDENSTYDLNFINGAKEAIANLGLTEADYILKTNVPEGQECYEAAVDMVDKGCNIIFADSFGHEPYMIQLRSILMSSSATAPALALTPRAWPTTTTLSPPSMRVATWPVSLPV